MKQVTKVVFLLNTTKVGDYACMYASNLVVVDIPEGGDYSFVGCICLKSIKFPKSLTSVGENSFWDCSNLEQVDLLHTNVRELVTCAFSDCRSLREMKIPDSLQTFGKNIFYRCSKLVPSTIDIDDKINYDDVTFEVVAYLRSIQ
ncbi:hypothetical protein TrVE_jg7159 [Triparma verrucosa]|uniref:Leucine rich repeat protein n=1 Tax=Triparma verrucosa TaxID=1606542 RepID=A0A9W7FNF9_9STRA|nr:hypothetical protein TrVE_jg7159 [Triparma verrucosa]